MSDIFLSYAHEDRERVRPVVAELEAQGWLVWWDRRVLPGQQWEEQLREELKNCRAVVVVNGIAEMEGLPDIEAIWADDPGSPGLKKNIGPIIDRGLELCY